MSYTTKKSLLRKVREGDEIGWNEFYETYKPLIIRRGMDYGLRPQELGDLVQKVMLEFFQKDLLNEDERTFRYDEKKGRFRDFLRGVVSNHAMKLLRSRKDQVPVDTLESILPDPSADQDAQWQTEWEQFLLTQALAELRNQVEEITYQAFEMYALKNRPAQQTADFLDLSVASVYMARSRCVAKLKNIIRELEAKS